MLSLTQRQAGYYIAVQQVRRCGLDQWVAQVLLVADGQARKVGKPVTRWSEQDARTAAVRAFRGN